MLGQRWQPTSDQPMCQRWANIGMPSGMDTYSETISQKYWTNNIITGISTVCITCVEQDSLFKESTALLLHSCEDVYRT